MNLSRKFLFAGNVQGVGFRAKVCSYAQNFKVTGYVKNMPTGDVEVYVEGSSLEIERFLEKIYYEMKNNITSSTSKECIQKNFSDFKIFY